MINLADPKQVEVAQQILDAERFRAQFSILTCRRIRMESSCTDPDEWERLADDYDRIGADVNALLARKRAQHYRQVAEGWQTS